MSAVEITHALARSRLMNSACARPDLFGEIERGEFATRPASSMSRVQVPTRMQPTAEKHRQVRVYDRAKARGNKRMMGGDGRLPNTIRQWFTEGERAVLSVIGAEVKRHGRCELPVLTIARRAGVGVRLVQYTLATARTGNSRRQPSGMDRPILINVEYRREKGAQFNDYSVITIISREWLLWLNYRPSEDPRSGCTEVRPNSFHTLQPLSDSTKPSKFATVSASQWAHEGGSAPPRAATGRRG